MRFAPCQTIGPRGMSTIPGPAGLPGDQPQSKITRPLRATFDLGNPPGDELPPVEGNAPPDAGPASPARVTAAADADSRPREIRFCVAIDFDGCLVRKAWPAVGEEMPGSMAFLRWIEEQGWWRVLFTCREGDRLKNAMDWLADRTFPSAWWTCINATPQPITDQYGHDSRKPGFHALVDDLAIGFPAKSNGAPDWDRIKTELEERAAAWNKDGR